MYKNDGFINEIKIKNELNNVRVKKLNPMYRDFIEELYGIVDDNTLIRCCISKEKMKYDLVIDINNIKKYISVKMGTRNSIHVEGISSFIHFLIENKVDRNTVIEFLKYHYADGTTNGTGKNRLSVQEYKKINQDKIDMINKIFNREDLIIKFVNRFILVGNIGDVSIDALLYGTHDDILWIKKDDIMKLMLKNKDIYQTGVHISMMSIQPLDRCLNYNPKYESRRFCIQAKWYNIFDDIIIYKYFDDHVI